METIKFRGKRTDNGEWVYGSYYTGTMTDAPHCINDCRICHVIIVDGVFYHVDPLTVGQLIGINDLLLKEYFEGDIYKYDNPNYGYGDPMQKEYCIGLIMSITDLYDDDSLKGQLQYATIIGNYHDNPELLNI